MANVVRRKPFSERVLQPKGYCLRPHSLLDVSPTTSSETIKILARYWKNKYHPDKGGDPDIFNQVCRAEAALLAERGVQ